MIYALIPARGGSKRIPRKNMQKVGGISLVARASAAARDAVLVDRVYVSTEDREIATEARVNHAFVIDRPQELAGDEVRMEAVVAHFLEAVSAADADAVVILEPTATLRTCQDIDAAVDLLRHAEAVRIVSAVEAGCHPITYRDAGIANAIRVGAFRVAGCLFPTGTVLLHRGDERAVDIDEPADLERARALAQ